MSGTIRFYDQAAASRVSRLVAIEAKAQPVSICWREWASLPATANVRVGVWGAVVGGYAIA
jgi:hypothetical protein